MFVVFFLYRTKIFGLLKCNFQLNEPLRHLVIVIWLGIEILSGLTLPKHLLPLQSWLLPDSSTIPNN